MTNVIYVNGMYNSDDKNEFLSKFNKKYSDNFSRIFKISYEIETELGKDLYDFDRSEIRRLMFLYQPKTDYSSRHNLGLIKNYLDWALSVGYLKGISPLSGLTGDWSDQFVVPSSKKYWTEDELLKITSPLELENAQDAIIPTLIFYGVSGQENNEITNLKEDDVLKETSQLRLTDSFLGKQRVIDVPVKVIKLCEAALRETDYVKSNGKPSKKLKAKITTKLIENEFVVRSSNTKTFHLKEAEKNIAYRRLETIRVTIEQQNFTPNNILYSGMIWMAKNLFEERGVLGDIEYKEIFEHYGEYSQQTQSRYRSEFVNLETIKEVYELS